MEEQTDKRLFRNYCGRDIVNDGARSGTQLKLVGPLMDEGHVEWKNPPRARTGEKEAQAGGWGGHEIKSRTWQAPTTSDPLSEAKKTVRGGWTVWETFEETGVTEGKAGSVNQTWKDRIHRSNDQLKRHAPDTTRSRTQDLGQLQEKGAGAPRAAVGLAKCPRDQLAGGGDL